MSRRAQGSVAHCPYCEASLPRVAAECPECRFPLTMAAAEFGQAAPEGSGTTSTATPGGRAAAALVPGLDRTDRSRVHGSQGHRMRITAWLLGVTSILLLLAGLGALLTASSPGAASDRQATTSLLTALHRATDDPQHRQEVAITALAADESSASAQQVSAAAASGFWFGAAKSTSGHCFLMAGKLADGVPLARGTLAKDEPCTGAHVRFRLEARLLKAEG